MPKLSYPNDKQFFETKATIQLNGTSISTSIEKHCPQGSLLSPFLWNIVVDEALNLQLALYSPY